MQFRKTSSLALAAAVAAMLAASQSGVRAQDATMPPPAPGAVTTPGTSDTTGAPAPMAQPMTPPMDSTMPMNGTKPMSDTKPMDSMPMSGSMSDTAMPNFSLLNNGIYDYVDLQQAKARGLSDNQIATTAKIAKEADVPFNVVSAAVERGQTFPYLAGQYNIKLSDVYKNDKQKQEINEYMAAYDAASLKSAMMPPMMPMGGDTSSMPMTMPMDSKPMDAKPMDSKSMDSKPMANTATLDIVETAMAAKNLTTLVKALEAAGLVDTLKTAGPFTVFAPDDKAFAKLPAGKLDALMADPAMLKSVLSYHVIPAEIMAADAKAMTSPTSPPTVEGGTLEVTKGRKGQLMVNGAKVTKGDIRATNGVIHIIDTVLMPPDAMAAPASGTTPMAPPADGTTPMAPPADGTTPMAPPADGTTPVPAPAQ